MSDYERSKGLRIEREIVNLHRDINVRVERVPLSGATRYQGGGHDVDVYPPGLNKKSLRAEVKARASGAGFTMLERWLADYDLLFLRRDRALPLVVLPWKTYVRLLACHDELHTTVDTQPKRNGRLDAVT
jgi:Holliday junction resolvase